MRRIEKKPLGLHKIILNVLKSVISGAAVGPARMQPADAGDPSKPDPALCKLYRNASGPAVFWTG
jgi:hypothetical protein